MGLLCVRAARCDYSIGYAVRAKWTGGTQMGVPALGYPLLMPIGSPSWGLYLSTWNRISSTRGLGKRIIAPFAHVGSRAPGRLGWVLQNRIRPAWGRACPPGTASPVREDWVCAPMPPLLLRLGDRGPRLSYRHPHHTPTEDVCQAFRGPTDPDCADPLLSHWAVETAETAGDRGCCRCGARFDRD